MVTLERNFYWTHWIRKCVCVGLAGALSFSPLAPLRAGDDVYMKPSVFLSSVFQDTPRAGAVTLTAAMQSEIKGFLGRAYTPAMVRYWASGDRAAWILNEIGKTKPITAGFVVDGGVISRVEVLIYRESHGWEVRQPFFTEQFRGADLVGGAQLTKRIDSISGATLSVRALTKLAKLALYLDTHRVGA